MIGNNLCCVVSVITTSTNNYATAKLQSQVVKVTSGIGKSPQQFTQYLSSLLNATVFRLGLRLGVPSSENSFKSKKELSFFTMELMTEAEALCNFNNHPCILYVEFALSVSFLVDENIEKQYFPNFSSSISVLIASTADRRILSHRGCKDKKEKAESWFTEYK